MNIARLFSHNAGESAKALQTGNQQLLKKSLRDLERFTTTEVPKLTATHSDSMAALELLAKQARAAIKK